MSDQPQNVTHIYVNAGRGFSPIIAGLFSLLLPGLGQIYKGQLINGVVWFFAVAMGYVFFVLPGVLLHFCCVIGAMMGSRR